MKKINWRALITSLAISLGVGALAAFLSSDGMQEKYNSLYQPPLAPPGWLFPIVWTILYILMGYAAYLVYESKGVKPECKMHALRLYGAQLAANFVWPILFFRFDAYMIAFVWLVFLWFLIYRTYKAFHAIEVKAGYLLIPYLLWVTFAGYLNLAIAIYYMG